MAVEVLDQVVKLKSQLPIMIIEDSKSYKDWNDIFADANDPSKHLPQDIPFNMIGFANMYNVCI